MTKVEVHFEFERPFEDGWTEAIERLHGVYGLQAMRLNPRMEEMTVLYDASRLTACDVERHLRMAGLPVRRAAGQR